MSYHSHFDDTEKHLIGNLLSDQDDSYLLHSSGSSQSSTRDRTSSTVASSNAVGPIGAAFSSAWPEPPPPYTPSSLFLPPPPGLPGSTWTEASRNRRDENAVDDWSSFLAKKSPAYTPYTEHTATHSAPVSAPVHNDNSMPFSYRDVLNRGVSQSMNNSRHGSSSTMPKEGEKNEEEARMKSSNEEVNQDTRTSWKGAPSDSQESFQQITRKKGQQKTQNMMGDGKGSKARVRPLHVSELMDPQPIEDNSRFTILDKLPERRNTCSLSEDEGSFDSHLERTPIVATLTKNERRANGNNVNVVKKRVNRRDDRGETSALCRHATIVIGWIRLALAYMCTMAVSVFSYVLELTVDFGLQLTALTKFGLSHAWMQMRCKVHEIRGKATEWWNSRKKGEEQFGLVLNIRLPETAEEALERLLNARGEDAYAVLGVRSDESDEVIKSYYKKQALLVHPDKNLMDGAAEAFQILSKAYEVVSTPDKRRKYNAERMQAHPLHKELTELYHALKTKMEETRNRMDCDCGMTHMRVACKLPMQAARYCRKCDTRHACKNLDIWVESRFFGLIWVYYTCVNGIVYDISSWANCSTNQLKHLKADNHNVIYRMLTTQQNREARQRADRYLRMLSEGLEKATSMHVSAGNSQASLQPIEREEDRPRKAKRAGKKPLPPSLFLSIPPICEVV
ncbi:hypothetical protein PFISCL1PPCAC_6314 [Pristionchus fissidentatus]|uniref:J domain-containing protein n=1 Tax=Pristionchus fissidentatus TaxID=1538716 RepID=A0AAV5V8B6_9BILA|nr:hypothetical protein PFISCL1PPCAC_6314 [Pristionchus fissidentatus]